MNIPRKGDYMFHAKTGEDYELHRLKKRVAELENGEALKKALNDAEYWRDKYEKEHQGRKKDARKAKAAQTREVRKWQKTADDVYEEANAAMTKVETLLEKLDETRKERDKAKKDLEDALNQIGVLKKKLNLTHKETHYPSTYDKPPVNVMTDDLIELDEKTTETATDDAVEVASESNDTKKDETEAEREEPKKKGKRHNRNSRKKSNRKRGAQPNHPHHPRKQFEPDGDPIMHDEKPAKIEGDPDWYPTERYKYKDVVKAHIVTEVERHAFRIWRNRKTGAEATLPIPHHMKDETNYDASVDALALLIKQKGNVPVRRVAEILNEGSNGALEVSTGWVAERLHVFAQKAKEEVNEAFRKLFGASYQHVDCTTTKVNGKQECIAVSCNDEAAYFAHSEHKGDAAINKLPCAKALGYDGYVVSDREAAIMKVGKGNQVCLAHLLRDLQKIVEMEPDKTWALDMIELFVDLLEVSADWQEQTEQTGVQHGPTPEQVSAWEETYDQILANGRQQYIDKPPTRYFLEGYDLRVVLGTIKDRVLLFLHKPFLPPTNNAVEREIKNYKRTLRVAQTHRSKQGVEDQCDFMTVTRTAVLQKKNMYKTLLEIISRHIPAKAHTVNSKS